MVVGRNGMGRNGYGPKWSWAEMVMVRNDSLPGQFADIHSPDKLSDHDIVSGTLKIAIPPIKKPRRKVYRYQKGDYESMRAETLQFAKESSLAGQPSK